MGEIRSNEQKISGTLFPTKWDKKGQVLGLVLDTPDQDGYFIAQNKKGNELMPFINHEVEVTGTLTENDDGRLVINVKDFRIIEGRTKGQDGSFIEPVAAVEQVNQ